MGGPSNEIRMRIKTRYYHSIRKKNWPIISPDRHLITFCLMVRHLLFKIPAIFITSHDFLGEKSICVCHKNRKYDMKINNQKYFQFNWLHTATKTGIRFIYHSNHNNNNRHWRNRRNYSTDIVYNMNALYRYRPMLMNTPKCHAMEFLLLIKFDYMLIFINESIHNNNCRFSFPFTFFSFLLSYESQTQFLRATYKHKFRTKQMVSSMDCHLQIHINWYNLTKRKDPPSSLLLIQTTNDWV